MLCALLMLLWCEHRRKLLKAFYSDKKQQFDISKVPDIYDSAKYDAIHNSELGLTLKPLYTVSHPSSAISSYEECLFSIHLHFPFYKECKFT